MRSSYTEGHGQSVEPTSNESTYTAFAGSRTIARGRLEDVVRTTKQCLDAETELRVVLLEDATSREVDFDFSGSEDEVAKRAQSKQASAANSNGAATSCELITHPIPLLARHWDWLRRQPVSASVVLGRLIDDAMQHSEVDGARAVTGRLMWAMARDLPDAEQTSKALLDADEDAFRELAKRLPRELRDHLETLLRECDAAPAST